MNEKLVVQKSISADGGRQRVSLLECQITGDLILRFGNSYTLRAPSGEMAALLLKISVEANAASGGVLDGDV